MHEDTFDLVEIKEYYIKRVASGMRKYFFDAIFKPIFVILQSNSVINSKNALINAIRSHRIYYKDGAFRTDTRFSNDIAKTLEDMGAVYKSGSYFIERSKIPLDIIQALSIASNQALYKLSAIQSILQNLDTSKFELEPYIKIAVQEMYKTLEKDIAKSALKKQVPVIELGLVKPKIDIPKPKAANIEKYWKNQDKKINDLKKKIKDVEKRNEDTSELEAELNDIITDTYSNAPNIDLKIDNLEIDEQSKKIASDYVYNMKFWVKKWEVKNITKMREDVLELVKKGARIPEIEKYFNQRWKIAGDKAYFLAKNESHLAASVIIKTQYEKLGCNRFLWGRSSSKEKRELHKEYYNKIFYFDDPPIIDEKLGIKGLPRQIWNCLPAKEPIVSPFFYKRIYRRWYTGELTTLVTSSGYSLNTTPNHPILTNKGWVGAGSIKVGDKIAKVKDDFIFSTCKNPQNTVTTIDQLFDFFSVFLNPERVTTTAGDFHGDGMVDKQVEIINIKSNLFFDSKTVLDKDIVNFFFTKAEDALIGVNFSKCSSFFKSLNIGGFIPQSIISIFDKMLTLVDREFAHSDSLSIGHIALLNTLFIQMVNNSTSCDFEMLCNSLNTPPFKKHTFYRFIWELFILIANTFMTDDVMPVFTHAGTKITSVDAELLGDFKQIQSFNIEFDTVVDKASREFNNHVFNLENMNNWYLYHNYIIKNCLCHMEIVVPTLAELQNKRKQVKNEKTLTGKLINAATSIFKSKQCDNNPWRYRRFGQGETF